MEKNIFEINEITCIVYANKNPEYLLIQPVNEPHAQMLDQQIRFMTEHTKKSFLLAAFLVKDWNQDLSPWCAPAVFGKESFGEGAGETLAFIEKMLIPEIAGRYKLEEGIKDIPVILGGYSLAGLFALWSTYQERVLSNLRQQPEYRHPYGSPDGWNMRKQNRSERNRYISVWETVKRKPGML